MSTPQELNALADRLAEKRIRTHYVEAQSAKDMVAAEEAIRELVTLKSASAGVVTDAMCRIVALKMFTAGYDEMWIPIIRKALEPISPLLAGPREPSVPVSKLRELREKWLKDSSGGLTLCARLDYLIESAEAHTK